MGFVSGSDRSVRGARSAGFQPKVAGALRRHIDNANEALPDSSRERDRHFSAIRQLVDYVTNLPDEDPTLVGLWQITFAFGNAWEAQWEPTPEQQHVIAQAGFANAAPSSGDVLAELVCAGVEDLNRKLGALKGDLTEARNTLSGADDRVRDAEARAIAANAQRDAAAREADQLRADLESVERQLRVFRAMHGGSASPEPVVEAPTVAAAPSAVLEAAQAVAEAVEQTERPYGDAVDIERRRAEIEAQVRQSYSTTGGIPLPADREVGRRYPFGWGITQRLKASGSVVYEIKRTEGLKRVREAYTTPAAALSRRAQLEGEGKLRNPNGGES